MNPTESLLNNGRQVKKDYQTLHKVLKKRCEEIAKVSLVYLFFQIHI